MIILLAAVHIKVIGLPYQSDLGKHSPLAAAQQHPHVHSVLQSRGQFARTAYVQTCVCVFMHVICELALCMCM